MRSTLAIVSLLSLSTFAVAQNYGRFPCTIVNGDGTFSADPNQCQNDALAAPGSGEGGTQGDNPNPVNPTCAQDAATGQYYCGIAGATCTSTEQCDNGECTNGVCTGGPGAPCGDNDAACSGFLYCTDADSSPTVNMQCGGVGAYCQDPTQGDPNGENSANSAIFDQFCASGFCNLGTGNCDVRSTTVGSDCSTDTAACGTTADGQQLTCNESTQQCEVAAAPSGRARARRNLARRSLCIAANEQACAVDGGKGFECIDTSSNLENCGACGTDCTALPGVEAVGCSQGTCEIWSCAEGYTWSPSSQVCELN
ncbi:hypothetical protein JCM5353_000038 [Sporobolomyces roseus]